jgi:UDP-N-acetylglucosamine 2-epimerase
MKIVSIVGARPQFIKCAALSRQLRKRAQEIIVHTGQHYDSNMSDVFFKQLEMPQPDHFLEVGSGLHGAQTGAVLARVEAVLMKEKPDMVVVFGDTNSTLGGALAAAKLDLPIAHVEAGLRSFRRSMPEEINRIVTDRLSTLLFVPSEPARRNLEQEGLVEGVHVVGDVMYDVLLAAVEKLPEENPALNTLGVVPGKFALATIHRAENTTDAARLGTLTGALEQLAERALPVVWPVHPRTAKLIREWNLPLRSVKTVEPLGYLEMLALMRQAKVVLTDSGGVQKEAYWLGVPCVTMREETEWVETVQTGWNRIVGNSPEKLVDAAMNASPGASTTPLYGDGRASEHMASVISSWVGSRSGRSDGGR